MSNDEFQHLNFWKMKTTDLTKEDAINILIRHSESGSISDGYHTFNELYEHRNTLFIILAKYIKSENTHHVWRSIKHSDGTMFKGWYVMGINKLEGEQLTYHLPIETWESTNFAETLAKAPDFDGHTPEEVLKRLNKLLK